MFESQIIFANPEYTIVSETEETIFVTDETGAPHVFTREEWNRMNGGGVGGVICAAAVLGLAWLIF